LKHIELFAGCGGLSLGLERAGFELALANELSPMAAETFAYNFFKEDLSTTKVKSKHTFWLSSKHKDISSRLRENPLEYPQLGKGITDIPSEAAELEGKLIVGNIIQLNQLLKKNKTLLKSIKVGFDNSEIDLVSGGPPCQSFSLAGLRNRDCDKNVLPWEFANFVELIKPKLVILENVSGILRPFKEDGNSFHAWFEVSKAFASKGYVPLCLHINARLVGVPQNRPRFIMIGVRSNIYNKLAPTFNDSERELFTPSYKFFKKIKSNENVSFEDLQYFDVKNKADLSLFNQSFLAPLINQKEVTVKDAIHDLRFNSKSSKSTYIKNINDFFSCTLDKVNSPENHEPRRNNEHVQRRFRIYQVLQKCSAATSKQVFSILKKDNEELCTTAWSELRQHEYLSDKGTYVTFKSKAELIKHLQKHPTKKRSQKALDSSVPAPAALSIPDDTCHYDYHELRTLTVREMARIQSFPDSFTFKSKVTTGGQMRKFEVPQYTQVGNAVPPLLGFALGEVVKSLLKRL